MVNAEQRFVITGMGAVTSLGHDVESTWQAIVEGRHGIVGVSDTILDGYHSLNTKVAAPVIGFDLLAEEPHFADLNRKELRDWDMSAQFVLAAGAQALRQAGLLKAGQLRIDQAQVPEDRYGIFVGTGIGGANILADIRLKLEEEKDVEDRKGDSRVKPNAILRALPGRVASVPAKVFGAKAFWESFSTECASGNRAIIKAINAIKLGEADIVLAGGVEGEMTPQTIGAFEATRAVDDHIDPEQASRPFDESRRGLVMSSGAGMLVVESMDSALARGVTPLAEVIGYHFNADAKGDTEPDPENVIVCLKRAVAMTRRSADEIRNAYINPHATSTIVGDRDEMLAIAAVFPPEQVAGISSTKGATGHMMGAAGAAEAIFSIKALNENIVPPSLKLDDPIKETEGYVDLMSRGQATHRPIDLAVNNSFGFGGANAVTIYARPE